VICTGSEHYRKEKRLGQTILKLKSCVLQGSPWGKDKQQRNREDKREGFEQKEKGRNPGGVRRKNGLMGGTLLSTIKWVNTAFH